MTTRKDGRTMLTREDVIGVVAEELYAEYGGYQPGVAARIITALENEGAHHDGWDDDQEENPDA